MEHVLIGEHDLLTALSGEHTQSPEDFITYLEEALESGELTIDEVAQLIHDLHHHGEGLRQTHTTQGA